MTETLTIQVESPGFVERRLEEFDVPAGLQQARLAGAGTACPRHHGSGLWGQAVPAPFTKALGPELDAALDVPVRSGASVDEYRRALHRWVGQGGPSPNEYAELTSWFDQVASDLESGVLSQEQELEFREILGEALSASTMQGFAFCKPHGDAWPMVSPPSHRRATQGARPGGWRPVILNPHRFRAGGRQSVFASSPGARARAPWGMI